MATSDPDYAVADLMEERALQHKNDDTQQPPITLLNEDVLLIIFMINSHVLNGDDGSYDHWQANELARISNRNFPRAVDNNRAVSQVCRRWREVSLHSACLWANSINLKFLDQRTNAWRDEVLSRTGGSDLTVISSGVWKTSLSRELSIVRRDWLLSLLTNEWDRIVRLVVVVDEERLARCVFSAVTRGSKRIRFAAICGVTMMWHRDAGLPTYPLFPNSPSLQHLRFDSLELGHGPQDPRPFWPSSIRHLVLTHIPSVNNLLQVLKNLQRLETLSIGPQDRYSIRSASAIVDNPCINMPRLQKIWINLNNSPGAISEILNNLVPAEQCILKIKAIVRSAADVHPLCGSYLNFVHRYHGPDKMRYLYLALVPLINPWPIPVSMKAFDARLSQDHLDPVLEFSADLDSTIDKRVAVLPVVFVNLLRKKLNLTGIQALFLKLPDNSRSLEQTYQHFQTFLTMLKGVRVLQADSATLKLLHPMQGGNRAILPKVERLSLCCMTDFNGTGLLKFLTSTARPIGKIYIPEPSNLMEKDILLRLIDTIKREQPAISFAVRVGEKKGHHWHRPLERTVEDLSDHFYSV